MMGLMQHAAIGSERALVQTKATILVVEDDAEVRSLVKRCLEDDAFEVWTVSTGAAAFSLSERLDIDLAIIDLRLPDLDGLVLVRQFSERLGIPVLVLSGLGEPWQRIEGLEAGADDYLPKPFDPKELVARVSAALRARAQATQRQISTSGRIRVDQWTIDTRRQTVSKDNGATISLSNAEYKLLKALLDRPNRVLSREQILALTHTDDDATERSVDIRVTRLRKKLESDPGKPQVIRTVRRLGYMLAADRIDLL